MLRERARQTQPFFVRIDIQEPCAFMYDPSRIPPWPSYEETFADKPASHLIKHKKWHLEAISPLSQISATTCPW
jgi:hypothetical protein